MGSQFAKQGSNPCPLHCGPTGKSLKYWFLTTAIYSFVDHHQFSSVAQSCLTLQPHGLQHTRPPYPSPTPGIYSSSCHTTICLRLVFYSKEKITSLPLCSFLYSVLFCSIYLPVFLPANWNFWFIHLLLQVPRNTCTQLVADSYMSRDKQVLLCWIPRLMAESKDPSVWKLDNFD